MFSILNRRSPRTQPITRPTRTRAPTLHHRNRVEDARKANEAFLRLYGFRHF